MKKRILVDFDGTLHSYTTEWEAAHIIPDPPVPGAIDFLRQLHSAGYEIAIFTTRAESINAKFAILDWLEKNGLERGIVNRLQVTDVKGRHHVLIDDRAIPFRGTFPTADEIAAFLPWNRRTE
jgi:hypothetical protein